MNIVVLTYPQFIGHKSIQRFENMLVTGMTQRGHTVDVWAPDPLLVTLSHKQVSRKWLGYVDQFVLFPQRVRRRVKACPSDTLFVIIDNGLGPWVPLVAHRPHVIHCHDFLAQQSARGGIAECSVSWTGRQYQQYIRQGYKKGRNFISVSEKTHRDMQQFLNTSGMFSRVVYNGMNQDFTHNDPVEARARFGQALGKDFSRGYLLHVGGNQWYKNREGLIKLYDAWRSYDDRELPLLMIGDHPSKEVLRAYQQSNYRKDIEFLSNIGNDVLNDVYSGASMLIFPSLAEGFGWPIAEAMACGCLVVTTDEPPMNEVAGDAAFFIPRFQRGKHSLDQWTELCAPIISKVLSLSEEEKMTAVQCGIENSKRFKTSKFLDEIAGIYHTIIKECNDKRSTCNSRT